MNVPAAAWLEAARPKTLVAALVPVALGTSLAVRADAASVPVALTCLAVALLLQVATNWSNDYEDWRRGADTAARLGPRRLTAAGVIPPGAMRAAAFGAFAAAFLAGLPLVAHAGWPLLVIGAASVLAGWAYTGGPFPLAYHGFGDVFVILFFGLVAVAGTQFAQTGVWTAEALAAGLGVGLAANQLLVANNVRDAVTDAAAGKRTLVVRFGPGFGTAQYAVQALAAAAVPAWFAMQGGAWGACAAWLALPLQIAAWRSLRRAGGREDYLGALGRSAGALLVYGFGLAAGLALT